MKIISAWLFILLSLSFSKLNAQQKFNGNFESLNRSGIPEGWDLTFNGQNSGVAKLDSLIKVQGRYAICLTAKDIPGYGVAIDYEIRQKFSGKNLILVGNIKTENITDGFAGLWIRTDDRDQQLAIELMEKQNLKGTNEWKEYMVTLPYDEGNTTAIHIGAVLTGKGKMWVDSLRLYLDEVPIDLAQPAPYATSSDTLYRTQSGIDTIENTTPNINKLVMLGQVWGFLKYHHPAIARGEYNWDAELFKILPSVLATSTDSAFSKVLEKWSDGLGTVSVCKNCKPKNDGKPFLKPDYGNLFDNSVLSQSLIKKLQFIKDNANNSKHYYISFEGASNPNFSNEKNYNQNNYPDAGLRLLSLYRYWSSIQYFSPNRNLTAQNWNLILPKFIPKLILADNKYTYVTNLVKLVSSINDSHGFIGSSVFESNLGKNRLPVEAKYIENKLVVTGIALDSLNMGQNLKIGDEINMINGSLVDDMIQNYLPVTSSSNFDVAMRDMVNTYLLRSNEKIFDLQLVREGKKFQVMQTGVLNTKIKIDLFGAKPKDKVFQLINPNIGYISGYKFKKKDLDSISKVFIGTKGLIVDMRGYPVEELIHTLGGYLGTNGRPFVKFTKGTVRIPGRFEMTRTVKSGKNENPYKGKIIVMVNSVTQSNAEFVTMAFQTAKNVKVIGSTTAGADGNISAISLPGGFKTWISGIGVFYPDGTNAQRAGVKIDLAIKPTINGIRDGKDEVLEKAIELIMAQ